MIIRSLSNMNSFKIIDEISLKKYYGCYQEWYTTEWQRVSGCGPTVVSNIILYLTRPTFQLEQSWNYKANCLSLMEEVWDYVTPTSQGIPTTKMLYEGVLTYTTAKAMLVEHAFCDVPQDKSHRPKLPEVLKFLEGALLQDVPIAFMNLCNGAEKSLMRWHWVTVISLAYSEARDRAFVTILDEGLIKNIDLGLWYHTTTLGGGFVYFIPSPVIFDKH